MRTLSIFFAVIGICLAQGFKPFSPLINLINQQKIGLTMFKDKGKACFPDVFKKCNMHLRQHCGGVYNCAIPCIHDHYHHASKPCQLANPCHDDIQKFCMRNIDGWNMMMSCLWTNKAKLSAGCLKTHACLSTPKGNCRTLMDYRKGLPTPFGRPAPPRFGFPRPGFRALPGPPIVQPPFMGPPPIIQALNGANAQIRADMNMEHIAAITQKRQLEAERRELNMERNQLNVDKRIAAGQNARERAELEKEHEEVHKEEQKLVDEWKSKAHMLEQELESVKTHPAGVVTTSIQKDASGSVNSAAEKKLGQFSTVSTENTAGITAVVSATAISVTFVATVALLY